MSGWGLAKRVLCVRLDSLGDVLMTSPALAALKHGAKDRQVTLLTSPAGSDAARCIPEIDDIIVYDAPWMKATAKRLGSKADHAMIECLRRRAFDAAAIFTVYSQNPLPAALLCQLSDIPLRLGYCRENPYQLLTDWRPELEPHQSFRHEVERQLDLVRSIGCTSHPARLSLHIPDAARQSVDEMLGRLQLADRHWIAIHPGASAPSRRYAEEGFAAAASTLARGHGYAIVFTGTKPERELVDSIRGRMNVPTHSLAGDLSFGELAALLQRAPLLIANNTGPVHIAAAVGTPVVDLYALTNPQHTPWGVAHRVLNHDVPCKYCYKSVCPEKHHNCLRLVPPEAIVRAALELLEIHKGA